MKRVAMIVCTILLMTAFSVVAAFAANDFPSQPTPPVVVAKPAPGQPQPFYGFVPPPPIRHTWPGGYKVILHEMMNTLSEHILGQY
jgi:hypothetical protein